MSTRPGTRFFIGPLTPAQQRRRERNRTAYRELAEIMDARYITFSEATMVMRSRHDRWSCAGLASRMLMTLNEPPLVLPPIEFNPDSVMLFKGYRP